MENYHNFNTNVVKKLITWYNRFMVEVRNFLFLYLNTGMGHFEPARIMKAELENLFKEKNIDGSVFMINGFGPNQHFAHNFFEKGYRFACLYAPGIYSAFYDLTCQKNILHLVELGCNWKTSKFLKKIIIEKKITDIVSFHFCVSPAARKAVRQIYLENVKNYGFAKKIPVTQIITDPYTVHPAWFLVKDAKYAVFSKELKDSILKNKLIPKENKIEAFPFILDKKFETKQIVENKENLVLVVGGGNGLKNIKNIVKAIISFRNKDQDFANIKFYIACGKSNKQKKDIKKLVEKSGSGNIEITSHIDNIDEILKKSCCLVTKAGASMLAQAISCGKPIIISNYIHGQELGNVRSVVNKKQGWFIQKPHNICKKILEIVKTVEKPILQNEINNSDLGNYLLDSL